MKIKSVFHRQHVYAWCVESAVSELKWNAVRMERVHSVRTVGLSRAEFSDHAPDALLSHGSVGLGTITEQRTRTRQTWNDMCL